MTYGTDLIQRAFTFAARHHAAIGQVRKYSGHPYIIHPFAVAELVRSTGASNLMVAAAYLHDVVEDTAATHDEVRAEFGEDVAALVAMVTNVSRPEDGNRAARKAIDRAHLAKADWRGQTIKLADIIDNTRDLVDCDPEFAVIYFEEKRLLLPLLTDGSPFLYIQAHDQLYGNIPDGHPQP